MRTPFKSPWITLYWRRKSRPSATCSNCQWGLGTGYKRKAIRSYQFIFRDIWMSLGVLCDITIWHPSANQPELMGPIHDSNERYDVGMPQKTQYDWFFGSALLLFNISQNREIYRLCPTFFVALIVLVYKRKSLIATSLPSYFPWKTLAETPLTRGSTPCVLLTSSSRRRNFFGEILVFWHRSTKYCLQSLCKWNEIIPSSINFKEFECNL